MNALTIKRVGFAVALRTNSIWLALLFSVSVAGRASGDTITLTTPGAGSIPVPAGYEWINVTVECWGGGGGGGGGPSGGGGGGGAYASGIFATLPSGSYIYYVGAGGAGGGGGTYGGSGADTYWSPGGAQSLDAGGGVGAGFDNDAPGAAGGLVLAGEGYPGGAGGGATRRQRHLRGRRGRRLGVAHQPGWRRRGCLPQWPLCWRWRWRRLRPRRFGRFGRVRVLELRCRRLLPRRRRWWRAHVRLRHSHLRRRGCERRNRYHLHGGSGARTIKP